MTLGTIRAKRLGLRSLVILQGSPQPSRPYRNDYFVLGLENDGAAQIAALAKPDFHTTWPMNVFIQQMDELEAEWGYAAGDKNTDGLLNAAYHFYGHV